MLVSISSYVSALMHLSVQPCLKRIHITKTSSHLNYETSEQVALKVSCFSFNEMRDFYIKSIHWEFMKYGFQYSTYLFLPEPTIIYYSLILNVFMIAVLQFNPNQTADNPVIL